jgi:hypothetical protein
MVPEAFGGFSTPILPSMLSASWIFITPHSTYSKRRRLGYRRQAHICIHDPVEIPQKQVEYRPTDKLIFATLGFIAGAGCIYDLNLYCASLETALLARLEDKAC